MDEERAVEQRQRQQRAVVGEGATAHLVGVVARARVRVGGWDEGWGWDEGLGWGWVILPRPGRAAAHRASRMEHASMLQRGSGATTALTSTAALATALAVVYGAVLAAALATTRAVPAAADQ